MEQAVAYRSDMNHEQRPAKGMIRTDGSIEAVSNDGTMKIILTRNIVLDGKMENEYFVSAYYVKEGDGWIKTSMHNTYGKAEDFVVALQQTEEFTQACKEITEPF